ncbi:MAG TPA: hypothetical protein VK890_10170, partial [Bacteroidia bacterium]|nr:hypothetical protein [Bacteroidia bacterium]
MKKLYIITYLLVVLCPLLANAQHYIITTIAGGGAGDGQPANIVSGSMWAVAIGDSGNIYVSGTNSLRKINANGILSTIAGNNYVGGFSGDGGPASAALFKLPLKVAHDKHGNIYVPDAENNRVRKIDKNGIVTTIAGNGTAGYNSDNIQATAAELSDPTGVVVDSIGNIYINDAANKRVRKIDTNGVITTFINGGGVGIFTLGDSGMFYYLNNTNNSIYRMKKGVSVKVAGTINTTTYSGEGGPATNACLASPSALAVDKLGNIYVGDDQYNAVRKINTKGIISTVKIPYYWVLESISSLATDDSCSVYIMDNFTSSLKRIDTSGKMYNIMGATGPTKFIGDNGPATSAILNGVKGIKLDKAGNIYFADEANYHIRKINTSGIITSIAGNGRQTLPLDTSARRADTMGLYQPTSVGIDKFGNIYVGDGNYTIHKIDTTTGITTLIAGGEGVVDSTIAGDGRSAKKADLIEPDDIQFDTTGNLFFSDGFDNRVRKISTGGIITSVAGTGYYGSCCQGSLAG